MQSHSVIIHFQFHCNKFLFTLLLYITDITGFVYGTGGGGRCTIMKKVRSRS